MKNYIKKPTKLDDKEVNLIKKCQKASDNYLNLKKMSDNADFMASSMPKLLKVIEKMNTINEESKDEIKRLKDAGGQALLLVNKGKRTERTRRHNHWATHRDSDV